VPGPGRAVFHSRFLVALHSVGGWASAAMPAAFDPKLGPVGGLEGESEDERGGDGFHGSV
jgi:hypothetical protein